jgi:hypothetical protein
VLRAVTDYWRPLALFGALLGTVPAWLSFDAGELAVLLPIVLVAPLSWVALARDSRAGPVVGALLVVCVCVWSVVTQLWASWATPSTMDDVLRGHLAVACSIVLIALRRERHRMRLARRPRLGLVLLVIACAAVVAVPDVGDAPIPDRAALLPLPEGVVIVAEEAGCDWPGSCQRRFETVDEHGADLMPRLTQHLKDRGWQMGTEHLDKACRPLGYVANPYRTCVSLLYLRGRGTVEVLFDIYNPRQPGTSTSATVAVVSRPGGVDLGHVGLRPLLEVAHRVQEGQA